MSIRKLLVATDFSPLAEKAYAVAARLSRRFGAPLHLAHVLETFPSAAGEFEDSVAEDFANALRETAESGAEFEGLTVVPHLLRGPAGARALTPLIEREGIDLRNLRFLWLRPKAALGGYRAGLGFLSEPELRHPDERVGVSRHGPWKKEASARFAPPQPTKGEGLSERSARGPR